ncbi:MAG: penicillin-binding protein [Bacteroidetes bacterium]|nr:MAG: penicillin-binding protein [Bacteroidota bacterium]
MSRWTYTEEELEQYFKNPDVRRRVGKDTPPPSHRGGVAGFFHRRFSDPRKAQAAMVLSVLVGFLLAGILGVGLYMLSLTDELPSLEQIENPNFQLASIAYTADGRELARYARQNRTWVTFEEISPHVINALIATEDHRFYEHWGIDLFRTMAIPYHLLRGDPQGGSTITQQLARNLYNEQIGRRVTVPRKLKEMITAVELERRYTKREIIEMYLNTVEFGYNAYGIEAAARTFYGKDPMELDPLESATLIGMLKGTTIYNPVTRPENARLRRNVVLRQMIKHGHLSEDYYEAHKDDPVGASYHSYAITNTMAPHFARYVGEQVSAWARTQGLDLYTDGLVIYTTLDSRLQELATRAVTEQMEGLQAVVDYEWSQPSDNLYSTEVADYLKLRESGRVKPFAYLWSARKDLVNQFIRETARFASLRRQGLSPEAALDSLRRNEAFMDSLKTNKTRLEAGLVSIEPRTGHVKVWVGGRKMEEDWNDHVAQTRRQPGSTFKPFVYTAAIHNGWSPYYTLPDSTFEYVDAAGNVWSPQNTGGSSGEMVTLRQGLARSLNTITARLMLEIGPSEVAFFARRMGIKSPLEEVPALALGTSDVTLLEITSAYATLANGGLYNEPVVVTRIEDRNGNVLFEYEPAPSEALSEATAYTMVDMLRAVIQEGTGIRIRTQFGLGEYDLAGKTGTTQNSADGWFILMHPDLVTGAWVGFNDRRLAFRTDYWGQGAHNALFLVGDFFRRATLAGDLISKNRFPTPEDYGLPTPAAEDTPGRDRGRISW